MKQITVFVKFQVPPPQAEITDEHCALSPAPPPGSEESIPRRTALMNAWPMLLGSWTNYSIHSSVSCSPSSFSTTVPQSWHLPMLVVLTILYVLLPLFSVLEDWEVSTRTSLCGQDISLLALEGMGIQVHDANVLSWTQVFGIAGFAFGY
jgi:hypothetical protein